MKPINNSWKTEKQIEKERKKRATLDRKNLQKRLKRAQQPGAGLRGRAFGLLNRNDGVLSIKNLNPENEKVARKPRQKSFTSVEGTSNQSNICDIETQDNIDLDISPRIADEREALRTFRKYLDLQITSVIYVVLIPG